MALSLAGSRRAEKIAFAFTGWEGACTCLPESKLRKGYGGFPQNMKGLASPGLRSRAGRGVRSWSLGRWCCGVGWLALSWSLVIGSGLSRGRSVGGRVVPGGPLVVGLFLWLLGGWWLSWLAGPSVGPLFPWLALGPMVGPLSVVVAWLVGLWGWVALVVAR